MGKNKKKTKSRPALQINLGTGGTAKPTASDSQPAPQAQEQAPQPAIPQATQTGGDADVWDENVWASGKKKKEREASQAEDKPENQPKDQQQDQPEATQDDETPKPKGKLKTKKTLALKMPRSLMPQHAQDQQQPQATPSQAAPPPGGSWAGMVATTPAQPSQAPQVPRLVPLRAGPVVGAVGPVTPGPQQVPQAAGRIVPANPKIPARGVTWEQRLKEGVPTVFPQSPKPQQTAQKAPQQGPQPPPQKAPQQTSQQASQQAISPAPQNTSSSAQQPKVQK